MKKTHFLNLEFEPGDFCWAILHEGETALAVKSRVVRVIHTVDLKNPDDKSAIPELAKQMFYQLSDGNTVMHPLRSKKEAEALIRKEAGLIVKPS